MTEKRLKEIESDNKEELWLSVEDVEEVIAEVRTLNKTLEDIEQFCGPAKMSETVATMGVRLRKIKELIKTVRGEEK